MQAYLFAQFMQVVTYTGQQLQSASSHWALMFFILALGVGLAYFTLGWSSHNIAVVSANLYSLISLQDLATWLGLIERDESGKTVC
jgi:ATP-binding cassette subfamily B (MDR/TAP) protein 1